MGLILCITGYFLLTPSFWTDNESVMAKDKEMVELKLRVRKEVKERLREIAGEKARSMNGQILYWILKGIAEYEAEE